jgi:hypothetical protein
MPRIVKSEGLNTRLIFGSIESLQEYVAKNFALVLKNPHSGQSLVHGLKQFHGLRRQGK